MMGMRDAAAAVAVDHDAVAVFNAHAAVNHDAMTLWLWSQWCYTRQRVEPQHFT